MTENRLWILGADDPEMSAIEKLLTDCGEKVAYASILGVRVHPSNAYRANQYLLDGETGTAWDAEVVFVECELSDCRFYGITRVDHHRHGDPGYGKSPAEFLSASSIGQVVELLMMEGVLCQHEHRADPQSDGYWGGSFHSCLISGQELRFIAAADHCLGAAYQGQCPGVYPDELMAWRVKSRAANQGRTEEQITADIESTRGELCHRRNARLWDDNDFGDECNAEYYEPVGMTDRIYPELPEAACREGVAYVATVADKDGRVKDVLGGCTTPEMVTEWMAARRAEGREVYGDPARGFAGAYQP